MTRRAPGLARAGLATAVRGGMGLPADKLIAYIEESERHAAWRARPTRAW